jgi:hypothetical protein
VKTFETRRRRGTEDLKILKPVPRKLDDSYDSTICGAVSISASLAIHSLRFLLSSVFQGFLYLASESTPDVKIISTPREQF